MNTRLFNSAILSRFSVAILLLVSLVTCQHANAQSAFGEYGRYEQMLTQPKSLLEMQSSVLEDQLSQLAGDLNQLQRQTQKAYVQSDLTAEAFPEVVKLLQTQRVQLLIDLAGLNNRHEAMREANKQSEPKANSQVTDLIEASIAVNKGQLTRLKKLHESGRVSSDQLNQAELKMMEAKIKLAKHLEQSKQKFQKTHFSNKLLEMSLTRAEKQGRLNKTESLLKEALKSREILNASSDAEERAKLVRTQLVALEREYNSVRRQLSLIEKAQKGGLVKPDVNENE